MNRIIKVILIFVFIILFVYVAPKSPEFPNPPTDFVQSMEPADIETPLRRGYYTNLDRNSVISHYEKEFNDIQFPHKVFTVYTPRLNYPPEDAPELIRDQTKSTFLEEIVHPFRESIYINGFEPKTEEYAQFYKGIRYNQKIIIRYVPSAVWLRIVVLIGALVSSYFLINEYKNVKK